MVLSYVIMTTFIKESKHILNFDEDLTPNAHHLYKKVINFEQIEYNGYYETDYFIDYLFLAFRNHSRDSKTFSKQDLIKFNEEFSRNLNYFFGNLNNITEKEEFNPEKFRICLINRYFKDILIKEKQYIVFRERNQYNDICVDKLQKINNNLFICETNLQSIIDSKYENDSNRFNSLDLTEFKQKCGFKHYIQGTFEMYKIYFNDLNMIYKDFGYFKALCLSNETFEKEQYELFFGKLPTSFIY